VEKKHFIVLFEKTFYQTGSGSGLRKNAGSGSGSGSGSVKNQSGSTTLINTILFHPRDQLKLKNSPPHTYILVVSQQETVFTNKYFEISEVSVPVLHRLYRKRVVVLIVTKSLPYIVVHT
jgi:hypothetical protein